MQLLVWGFMSLAHRDVRQWQGVACAVCFCMCVMCEEAQAKSSRDTVSYTAYENPVVEFTRSLSRLNRVAEMCQDVQTADYHMYSTLIQQYVKVLYRGETPYWVLTEVKDRISDQTLCKWLVSESLIHYQFAYQDFVDVARPDLMPPVLTESMSQPGHILVDPQTLGVARPTKH